jgi:hypothetical protein
MAGWQSPYRIAYSLSIVDGNANRGGAKGEKHKTIASKLGMLELLLEHLHVRIIPDPSQTAHTPVQTQQQQQPVWKALLKQLRMTTFSSSTNQVC